MKINTDKLKKKLIKYGKYLGGFILLMVIMGFVVLKVTSQPKFCTSCHYMQPFYDAWAESTHSDVPCSECHYPPGAMEKLTGKFRDLNQLVKYLTNTYKRSKPWAEIEDASCLKSDCHSTRNLEESGAVEFGQVTFDHSHHLGDLRRGKNLRCTSCHSQIVQGEHINVTPSTCILCHFKELGPQSHMSECTLCHEAPVDKAGDETPVTYDHTMILEREIECRTCHGNMIVGDGSVPIDKCYGCHWDTERNSKFDDSILMHEKHIAENKIECENCHLTMLHKKPDRSEHLAGDCSGCHSKTHGGQESLFAGIGGLGVHDMPDPMFESGMNCQNCHVYHAYGGEFQSKGDINIAKPESCEPCHGAGYARILKSWQETASEKLQIVKNALQRTKSEITNSQANESNKQRAKKLVENAEHNYNLVKNSRAIHNIKYSDELLSASYGFLNESLEKIKSTYIPPALSRSSDVIPSQCANCHTGIENRKVYTFELMFDHGRHVIDGDLKCGTCHSNQRRHGELIVNKENCLSCHHQKPDCRNCHQLQADLYYGNEEYMGITEPNIMVEAELDCGSCHLEDDVIIRPTGEKCVECHGEGYDDMETEWKLTVKSSVENLELILKNISPAGLTVDDKALVERASEIVRRLKTDGSWGVHNETGIISVLDELEAEIKIVADKQTG
jgi:nitrate/TMAO reductase-like tetraheme cytochrome c subunit